MVVSGCFSLSLLLIPLTQTPFISFSIYVCATCSLFLSPCLHLSVPSPSMCVLPLLLL